MEKIINAYERFLRLHTISNAADNMRARAIYIIGWATIVSQILNLVFMTFSYGRWTLDHTVSVMACCYVLTLVHLLRYTKNFSLFAVLYVVLIFGGVAASSFQDATGINSALLPLMVSGIIMTAFISGWRMVIGYCVAAVLFIWLLYSISTNVGSMIPFDQEFYAERNFQRAVQATIAYVLISIIVSIFSYNMYRLFDRLEKSAVQAREADAAKSLFLANMSHELRTPLNGVIGMAELLRRTELDATQRHYTDIINGCSSGLVTIINDVLDLSRLDAEKIKFKSEPFNLRSMVTSLTDLHLPAAAKKSIALELHYTPNVPDNFIGDEARIRQITNNLIGNAMKFTRAGKVSVYVCGMETPGNRYAVSLYIQDTGIGIPPAHLDAVFERFEQVDSSLSSESQGTGLGLAIAKEMIEGMGGQINIESQVSVGTTIYFSLPLRPVTANAVTQTGAQAAA